MMREKWPSADSPFYTCFYGINFPDEMQAQMYARGMGPPYYAGEKCPLCSQYHIKYHVKERK